MVDLTRQISIVVNFWQRRGWQLDVQPTQAPEHAIELARAAALANHDLVFAGGGDGTIGEVANGLVGTDTVLAPLPMGTTNSFARELNFPMPGFFERHRLDDVMEALARGRVYGVDVGYNAGVGKNGRYWLMWSGIGADSFLIHALEPRPAWSRRLGRVGYTMQGLTKLPSFKSVHATVQVDHHTVEGEFVLIEITNCRLYAGLLPMNPHAKLDDGQYEVHLFKGRGVPKTLSYIAKLMQNRAHAPDGVLTLKGRHVHISTQEPIGCHADGDQAGSSPLISELRPKGVRLLVPSPVPSSLFVESGADFT